MKNNKESWTDVASLRKGLRGAPTIKPTANETVVPSPGNNNFDVLRDDDSSTRTPTKTVDLLQKRIIRYTSIMNVSDKVNSVVAMLIDQPYISPSQDPVQGHPPTPSIATPLASNKTSDSVVTLEDGATTEFKRLKTNDTVTQLDDDHSLVGSDDSVETYNDDDISYYFCVHAATTTANDR